MFYRSYQVLSIDPKNGQGELTTFESKALIFGLISDVHRIIIYHKISRPGDIHYWNYRY